MAFLPSTKQSSSPLGVLLPKSVFKRACLECKNNATKKLSRSSMATPYVRFNHAHVDKGQCLMLLSSIFIQNSTGPTIPRMRKTVSVVDMWGVKLMTLCPGKNIATSNRSKIHFNIRARKHSPKIFPYFVKQHFSTSTNRACRVCFSKSLQILLTFVYIFFNSSTLVAYF